MIDFTVMGIQRQAEGIAFNTAEDRHEPDP